MKAALFWFLPSWYQTLYWQRTHWLVVKHANAGNRIVTYSWEYKPDLKFKSSV